MKLEKLSKDQQLRGEPSMEDLLYYLWEEHFDDVPRKNLVLILFGKYSIRRLGSIKWAQKNTRVKGRLKGLEELHQVQDDPRISVITLTRYFAHEIVPEYIVKMTIAHEMVHYAHGFHSPLPKLYTHPHRGNIVNKELMKRGLSEELDLSEKWLKENWYNTVKQIDRWRSKK